MTYQPTTGNRPTRSLRREWGRAFTTMLVLLLLASTASILGVRYVVDQVGATARQLRHESGALAVLRPALVAHEEIGHLLLSDEAVNRSAFIAQQDRISREFDSAARVFPTAGGMRSTLLAADRSWQSGLETYGLWGSQVRSLHGSHETENPTFGAASDHTDALVNSLEGPSLVALDRGLAHDDDLEWVLTGALVAMFGLALAAMSYFRRRMSRDLLRPVAGMHDGVARLRAGEYEHRIDVVRRDELGELVEAINGMAGALCESHQALTHRATHDSLTGLPNRAALSDRLAHSVGPARDRRARPESVLFIDVDDFKVVNDSLGHDGGDALLVQLATRLESCVRPGDLVTRLGGDEFAIVVVEDTEGTIATQVAKRVGEALREPFTVGPVQITVSVSIGVAEARPGTEDATEVLRHADFAMYMAKGSGKDHYELFDAQMHDSMVDRSALKADLAVAVASDQLRLDYQPVVDLHTGATVGVEALVRWQHPTLGLLAPTAFIALAEETGDIDAIGLWVLETAARQAAGWSRTLAGCADLWVSVNLSPAQLNSSRGLGALRAVLSDPAVRADHVVLEITETAWSADPEGATAALLGLKGLGVRIALDDFGTGFSSLSTLAGLPVDILKIDRSFVSGLAAPSIPMLEAIVRLADHLDLTVIAEGVETTDQLHHLSTLGCRMGQGYLLGRPAASAGAEAMLARPAHGGLIGFAGSDRT